MEYIIIIIIIIIIIPFTQFAALGELWVVDSSQVSLADLAAWM